MDDMNERPGSRVLGWTVMILVLLSLAGGGWFTWKKVFAGPSDSGDLDVGTIPDRFRPRAMVVAPQPPPVKDGVNKLAGNMFRIQSGQFFMILAPTETTYAPLRLMAPPRDIIAQNDRLPIRFCNEAANAAVAKNLDVTAEQAKSLTAIRQQMNGGMKISDDDRNKLRELWKSWNTSKDAAAKSAAESALLAAMKDAGTRSLGASKQQYVDLAGQIRKIVSDQQIAKFRQLRGG